MVNEQLTLDLTGNPSARSILHRIRAESRDESEKGRWFEQLFMRIALQQGEFEIDEIWRWPDWPDREALTGPRWSRYRNRSCRTAHNWRSSRDPVQVLRG